MVCDDLEIDDFVVSCYDEGKHIKYERTTERSFVSALFFNN